MMFCAFEGPPKIVRFHGRGEVLEPGDADFASLLERFEPGPGVRSIIRVEIERIADSCGYGVPRMRFEAERTQLPAWAERKGKDGLRRLPANQERRQHRRAAGAAVGPARRRRLDADRKTVNG